MNAEKKLLEVHKLLEAVHYFNAPLPDLSGDGAKHILGEVTSHPDLIPEIKEQLGYGPHFAVTRLLAHALNLSRM
jgi:hypothetical protein